MCGKLLATTIPLVANEFILIYCVPKQDKLWMPKKDELIELTEHMCKWLLTQGYTQKKLL